MASAPVPGAYAAPVQSVQLLSPFGIYEPDKLRRLFGKVPRPSALSWMMATGRHSRRTAHNFTYSFWEEGQWFNAKFVIGATDIVTNPPNVIITIDAASHENSGKNTFPVINDEVVFNDETVGIIVDKDTTTDNAHTIEVAPATPSDDVATAAVATQFASVFSTAFPEDSTAPQTRVPQVTEEDNDIQTFRESFKVTDHEEKTSTWFTINGQPYLYVKGIEEAAYRFEQQQELAMLVGKRFSGVSINGQDVKATAGLIPTTRANGDIITYDKTSLQPDLDDFEAIILSIDKNYGPRDYFMGMGLNLGLKFDRMLESVVLGDTFGGGAVDFSPMKGKEQALSLNLKWVNFGGHQFFLQKWDIMSHEDSLGAAGMPYRQMGVGIPLGKVRNPRVEYGTKNFEDYYQVVYIPPAGAANEVREHYKLWETGGNAHPRATNDQLRREIHHACYKGFEMRNKAKFFIFEPEP